MAQLDVPVSALLAMSPRVEPRPVACSLIIDLAVVVRVLDALLTNAVRHAPAGGSVLLRAARMERLLSVAVADSSPGVPADLAIHAHDADIPEPSASNA